MTNCVTNSFFLHKLTDPIWVSAYNCDFCHWQDPLWIKISTWRHSHITTVYSALPQIRNSLISRSDEDGPLYGNSNHWMSPHWTSSVEIHDEHCIPMEGSKCAGTEWMHHKHAGACITPHMPENTLKQSEYCLEVCQEERMHNWAAPTNNVKLETSATIPRTLNTDQPTCLLIVQFFIPLAHTLCIKTVNKSFENVLHSAVWELQ